jgi:hypothetical protein
MAETNQTNTSVPATEDMPITSTAKGGITLLFVLLLIGGTAMLIQGIIVFNHSQYNRGELMGLGGLAIIMTIALYPITLALYSRQGSSGNNTAGTLESINHRMLISDTAKRILHRNHDRQALRRAIREDISTRDFEAALVLVNEMSDAYGYRLEAEQFRAEIEKAREAEYEAKLDEAIRGLDNMIARHDYETAHREAGRIERIFAESERVDKLRKQVIESRERFKHEIERKFLEAAGRDDIEVAMDLMKELDKYLSEQEAAPFRETARGVIGKKRQNLGVQFKLAVHDKEWTQSVRVGEQLIREFPNSKMAAEVRQMLDILRQRAAEEMAARPRELV